MSAELHRTIRTEMDASRTVLESTLYSREAGFDETPSRMIATAVSELVRNILKYAGSGEIRLRRVKKPGHRGIEIEAADEGPGIADCAAAMDDHFSSGGTLGLGLPGVKRMMDEFSLESTPG
ncbi:MAG: ATP-binding protein, partial [Gammaproteobacteria bacterium]|nr:ATP-binding protein [Gammaproteobacteria bacterium]